MSENPLFKAFDEDEVNFLIDHYFKEMFVEPLSVILTPRKRANAFYFLLSGSLLGFRKPIYSEKFVTGYVRHFGAEKRSGQDRGLIAELAQDDKSFRSKFEANRKGKVTMVTLDSEVERFRDKRRDGEGAINDDDAFRFEEVAAKKR